MSSRPNGKGGRNNESFANEKICLLGLPVSQSVSQDNAGKVGGGKWWKMVENSRGSCDRSGHQKCLFIVAPKTAANLSKHC